MMKKPPPDHSWLEMECVCCGEPVHQPRWWERLFRANRHREQPAVTTVPVEVKVDPEEVLRALRRLKRQRGEGDLF